MLLLIQLLSSSGIQHPPLKSLSICNSVTGGASDGAHRVVKPSITCYIPWRLVVDGSILFVKTKCNFNTRRRALETAGIFVVRK